MTTQFFMTRSGRRLLARPLVEHDAPLLVDLFHSLSSETRYHRFHLLVEQIGEDELWRSAVELADVDQFDRVAWIALETAPEDLAADAAPKPGRAVAVARAHRLPDHVTAEAAVVVRDDYQSQGVGGFMLRCLVNAAVAVGIESFIGAIQSDNRAMLHLLRKMGLEFTQEIEQGETFVRVKLRPLPEPL